MVTLWKPRTGGPSYFHGGQRGLRAGECILPPSVTGARHTLRKYATRAGLDLPARRDRVYVTTDLHSAMFYAALHPSRGWVYRVEPGGLSAEDPDCTVTGLSFEFERALILEVFKVPRGVVRDVREAAARGEGVGR